jgi:peroxiredoxin
MRSTLLILGMAIAAVAGGWYFFLYENQVPEVSAPEVNEYPYMNLESLDGKVQSARDLPGRSILIFFNPDCDHCQREAGMIRDHLDSFGAFSLYFISSDSLETIEQFAEEYGLAGKENVHFARTEVEEVIRNFGPIPAPSMYLYSGKKKLFREFKSETPIDQILGALSGR